MSRQKRKVEHQNSNARFEQAPLSVRLADTDMVYIEAIGEETGMNPSVIARGLIRTGLHEFQKKKISTLALIKLGA